MYWTFCVNGEKQNSVLCVDIALNKWEYLVL